MNTITTAADAIAESIRHTSIVVIDDAPGLRDDLMTMCDDNIESDGKHEFWGTDDEGDDWRVHVRVAA